MAICLFDLSVQVVVDVVGLKVRVHTATVQ